MKLPILFLVPNEMEQIPEHGSFLNLYCLKEEEATIERIKSIEADIKPVLVVSSGTIEKWEHLYPLHQGIRNRWCHFSNPLPKNISHLLISSYLKNNIDHPLDKTCPLISVFTTTFKSGKKLERPLQSLLNQTYDHWEWIIWDDSPEDDVETFEMLKQLQKTDYRIRVYRAPHHSGYIGEMKQLAAGIARGTWLMELDHDDIIIPELLQWIVNVHKKHSNAEFIYSDCIELFENTENLWAYGEGFGKCYGSYARQRIRGKYHYVAQCSPINPHTLGHIVGVPNHIRVWKKSFYESIGQHNSKLPVADDYELILKSFLASELKTRDTIDGNPEDARWVRIAYPAYYQFRNEGGNNFTFLRNALIQELVAHIANLYHEKKLNKYKALGWEISNDLNDPVWESRKHQEFLPVEHFYVPEDQNPTKPCISIVMPTYNRPTELRRAIESVQKQQYQNWILFIVGDNCKDMEAVLNEFNDSRIRFYNLAKNHGAGGAVPRNYALMTLIRTRYVAYLDDDNFWDEDHLSHLVSTAIENPDASYVFSSLKVDGKPIRFSYPKRGRIDTSCILHKMDLVLKYGYWKDRIEAGYAHDWEFVSRWENEKWIATLKPTLNYCPDFSQGNNYETMYNFYDDQQPTES